MRESAIEGATPDLGAPAAAAVSSVAGHVGAVTAATGASPARPEGAVPTAGAERRPASDAEPEDGPERPVGWCFLKTKADHDYVSDSSTAWNGSRSVWIGKQNDADADRGYFSSDILWQGVDARALRGARIEVSARVKGKGYFQFFVRTADAADTGIVLNDSQLPSVPQTNRYVNLFPPRGAGWERLSIVGDVPLEADVVYYGVGLMNGRAIWIDDVRLTRVEPQTPLTEERSAGGRFILPVDVRGALPAPTNLDFEATTRDDVGC